MRIEQHRPIEGRVKTMTIKREGKDYFAIFTAIKGIDPPIIKDTNPVGIDLGLDSFVALSDGTRIQKPKFYKRKARRIAHWQRVIAGRIKGSHRRERAKTHLQIEWKNVTNQSNDFMHKLSNVLVNSGYTSFAVESLNIRNMEKNHRLAQSIQNASWNRFVGFLSYKAESAGMKVVHVPAGNSTQECSRCGNTKEGGMRLALKDRTYRCGLCGLEMDRDINAAKVILKRATLGQRESHAQGEDVRPQMEAALGELRTYPAAAGGSLGL
jgi:putative transposase